MDITKVCNDIKELDQETQAAVAEFMRICKEKWSNLYNANRKNS